MQGLEGSSQEEGPWIGANESISLDRKTQSKRSSPLRALSTKEAYAWAPLVPGNSTRSYADAASSRLSSHLSAFLVTQLQQAQRRAAPLI